MRSCHDLDVEQEAGAAIAMAALGVASSGDRGRSLVALLSNSAVAQAFAEPCCI